MTSMKDKAKKRAQNFIDSFKALSLAGEETSRATRTPDRDRIASLPHFPAPSTQWPHPTDPAGIPPPPIFYSEDGAPLETSMTMRYATAEPSTPPRIPVPVHHPIPGTRYTPGVFYAETPLPRPVSDPLNLPRSPPPPRSDHASGSLTPQPPRLQVPKVHRRAQSEPLSPVSDSSTAARGTRQCNGVTTAGKQCRNQVKVSDAQALAGGDVFCRVHGNKVADVSGFYDRKTGQTFVKFEDWIPEYLQPATKNSLRVEMQKARAASDVEGYIYTFEILDSTDKKTIHLKVGRATNLNRRMDQWGKQCGSKEQILRGFWPGGMDKSGVPMKGLVQAGPKGPWCHRVERLVHIELADLVEHAPYLEHGYPNVSANKEVKKGGKREVKRCPDCNTKHQEIFSFERVVEGRYKGKEWEEIVKPVIEKWGGFVEGYL